MSELDEIRALYAASCETTAAGFRTNAAEAAAHQVLEQVPALLARVDEMEAALAEADANTTAAMEHNDATCEAVRERDELRARVAELEAHPASTAPLAAGNPHVAGRCPACNRSSLFLGAGGYVTCAQADCPDPGAASDALDEADDTETFPPVDKYDVDVRSRFAGWAAWAARPTADAAIACMQESAEHAPERKFRVLHTRKTYRVLATYPPASTENGPGRAPDATEPPPETGETRDAL